MDRDQVLTDAVRLHQTGHLAQAEALYARVLEEEPEDADALHFLGLVTFQRGDADRSTQLLERSLAVAPANLSARNNLGNILKSTGRLEDAEAAYRRVLALDPDHADAHSNLGVVLKSTGRVQEAADAFAAAIRANPDHAEAHHNLGNLLADVGRAEDAIASYRRAISINPGHLEALKALGVELYRAGRADEAAAVYRQLLTAEPDNPVAVHMLAACSGEAVPERASDRYVRRVFDAMADTFDQHLAGLGYRAPALVGGAVARGLGEPRGDRAVLDAGCGTGLCGPLLRPFARELVGVDLSAGMLGKAREGNLYDELVEAELTAFMTTRPSAFDLIACADTLVYFGALDDVFSAARGALRSGGWLIFTVERLLDGDAQGSGFRLNPHGRYSHSESYLRGALARAGLDLVGLEREDLRREHGKLVEGLVVSARV